MITEEAIRQVATENFSYKCDECGKIIAAPTDQPAPVCCEHPMIQIAPF
jgi:hypothetical protein